MHGRVKVKTSAEQAAAKEKERHKRAQKYLAVRNAIVARRRSHGADPEVIKMTTGLLSTLPDFGTMWNWRREGLAKQWADLEDEGKQKACVSELTFLNSCLKENPKSYSVWHQRRWVVQQAPTPPWKDELDNCSHFLKLDQRNFHCWDYRRFIVANSDHKSAEPEAEFAYSLEKISENFSNYSAWHYRTTLLPKVRPPAPAADGADAGAAVGGPAQPSTVNAVAADALATEFETCSSAFYIEPCDQSAWIYHRWLLGREETPPSVIALRTEASNTAITVVFSHPVRLNPAAATLCTADGLKVVDAVWVSGDGRGPAAIGGGHGAPSVVWVVRPSHPAALDDCPIIKIPNGAAESASGLTAVVFEGPAPLSGDGCYCVDGAALVPLLAKYQLPSVEILEEQLEMCNELMEELEDGPQKKWALLAIVYILYGLDPMVHRDQILAALDELAAVDPNRRGYYDDVKSKYEWEWAVRGYADSGPPVGAFSFKGKSLTSTQHLGHFFRLETLDLSSNTLRRLEGLEFLRNLVTLILDGNGLPGFYDEKMRSLPSLTTLSVCDNAIRSVRGLEGLRDLPLLKELRLSGNPVTEAPEFDGFAKSFLPYLARE